MQSFKLYDSSLRGKRTFASLLLIGLLLAAYTFASLAIDTGNLVYYGLTILAVIEFIILFARFIKSFNVKENYTHPKKNVRTRPKKTA